MKGLGRAFFASALVYGILGMLIGLHMGMSKDHAQTPTHAHILVVGWLSFAIFGLFYAAYEHAVPPLLARIHFWLAQVSLAGLAIGLWLLTAGRAQFEPVVVVSSIAYLVSFILFAFVVLPVMRARPV